MADEISNIDFWALKPIELARECEMIANGQVVAAGEELRVEARRLASEWDQTAHMPVLEFDDKARRAARIASLRKRTIQILVKVFGSN